MKILALDLGSVTGWATGINEKIAKHGYNEFSNHKGFTNESFSDFFKWLVPMVNGVDMVVCEKPNSHMPGWHALRVAFGMYGIVQAVVGAKQKSLIPVSAKAIKKFWTGYGDANKKDMVALAAIRGFKSVEDHNQCDAIATYVYFWEVLHANPEPINEEADQDKVV